MCRLLILPLYKIATDSNLANGFRIFRLPAISRGVRTACQNPVHYDPNRKIIKYYVKEINFSSHIPSKFKNYRKTPL